MKNDLVYKQYNYSDKILLTCFTRNTHSCGKSVCLCEFIGTSFQIWASKEIKCIIKVWISTNAIYIKFYLKPTSIKQYTRIQVTVCLKMLQMGSRKKRIILLNCSILSLQPPWQFFKQVTLWNCHSLIFMGLPKDENHLSMVRSSFYISGIIK